jgi:Skp family chaperone for outer membrane proteins
MSDDGWNEWLQANLAIERSQITAQVVKTVNELFAPRDAEIAALRKEIAQLRGQMQADHQALRRETKPNRFDPTAHRWTSAELKVHEDAAAAAFERLNKEHQ